MHFLRLLVATTILLSLLAFVPGVQAAIYQEGFEQFPTLNTPAQPPSGYTPFYTWTAGSMNSFVSTAQANTGTKSLYANGQATLATYAFDFTTEFRSCGATGAVTPVAGNAAYWWAYYDNLPAGGSDRWSVGLVAGSIVNVQAVYIDITSTGAMILGGSAAGATLSIAGGGPVVPTDTWIDLKIYAVCSSHTSAVANTQVCVQSVTLNLNACTAPASLNLGTTAFYSSTTQGLGYSQSSTAGTFTRAVYIDDLEISDNTADNSDYLIQWCSDHSATDFGYDFKEDVTRDTTEVGITIDPFYSFTGTSGNYGYLGKSFGGTFTQLSQFFRIEAGAEGANSNFRVVWSFVPATGTAENPVLDKGTGSTAGDSSGDFAQHIEVRFLEEGNDWDIAAFYVDVAGGITTRTQLGQSVNHGNPNTPTSYVATLNTVTGLLEVALVEDQSGVPVYIKSQSGDEALLGVSGNLTDQILAIDIFSGAGNYANDPIESAWFVGFHTDIEIGFSDAPVTALDENPDAGYSTCYASSFIIDPNGEPGGLPSTIGGGDVDGPGPGGDGTLFGAISDTLFMGFLLVFGVVWMGITRGAPGAAIGALFFIGLGLGYAIGWMPLWFILVLFVMSLAAVWFLPKPNQASGGLG